MADEREWKSASWKAEEDHSKETAAVLEKFNATTIPVLMRTSGQSLEDALQPILVMEKKARLGGDSVSTQKLASEIIKICRTRRQYDLMLTQLEVLVKKRAQMKQVQSAMVTEAQKALLTEGEDVDPDLTKERRLEILTKLEFVTSGKIHLELEHARFTVELAKIATAEGRKKEASDQLAAVQVETITNMPRLEKLGILLTEIELALDIDDLHRTQVMSRKINHRALAKNDTKEIKIRYFELLVRFYTKKVAPLHMARCWHEIYLTATDHDLKLDALSRVMVLATVSPHMTSKEIDDLAECCAFSPASSQTDRVAWLKELSANKMAQEELPHILSLTKAFTTGELIRGSTEQQVKDLCENHVELATNPFFQSELRNRVSEHDLLVVAKHYKRIHLKRLANLVALTEEQVEAYLMKLVISDTLYAKIDRVDGIVVFQKKTTPVELQEQWDNGVNKCMDLIDYTCHLISKERMIHAANQQAKALLAPQA